ncbi:replication-relaxation family protein [Candidatus Uabimicrobium amorphum]|uniref:Uncharacterized protein n=1 Tax=Uabimicrobium amorphum TaxID=2596890 RepID=A0A5S9IT85_UABAM|nr:replication-relaxation family protein [Candidatus Uabimicrobium amorphum]BBM87130.1 hypothetical protein UABAM_05533 [Candidatus Uabimicrobium amorphum]
MPIAISTKELLILQFLYEEGYATTKDISDYLFFSGESGVSQQNVQRIVKELEQRKIITDKHTYDKKELARYLTKYGLELLEKTKDEIQHHEKRIKGIRAIHLYHYFLMRRLEKILHRSFKNSQYLLETCNEFNHDGHLQVKVEDRWETCTLRSDGEVKISFNNYELLVCRVEIDTGTESISGPKGQIKNKFDNYNIYLRSNYINQEYQTYPVYVLFVTPQERIKTIITKLGNHEVMPFILFMPLERIQSFRIDKKWQEELDQHKIISEMRKQIRKNKRKISAGSEEVTTLKKSKRWKIIDNEYQVEYLARFDNNYITVAEEKDFLNCKVLYDAKNYSHCLKDMLCEREPILAFKNSVEKSIVSEANYQCRVHTQFSTPHKNANFPTRIHVNNKSKLWSPHGSFKLEKRNKQEVQTLLFSAIFVCQQFEDHVIQELSFYDEFLNEKHIQKITSDPTYYGCIIIVRDTNTRNYICTALRSYQMANRTIIILQDDCHVDSVFSKPVWMTFSGTMRTFFKHHAATDAHA